MKSLCLILFASIIVAAGCLPASAENIHMVEMERTHAMQDACGPAHRRIHNQDFTTNQYLAKPEDGKALVYFFFDPYSLGGGILGPHIHIGVDGKWVGALAPPSFMAMNLAPGTHFVCAKFSAFLLSPYVELATLHAQAGKTYAYTTSLLTDMHSSNDFLLRTTDPDAMRMYLSGQAALAAARASLPPNHILPLSRVIQISRQATRPAIQQACGPSDVRFKPDFGVIPSAPVPSGQEARANFIFDTHIWGGLIHPRGPVIQIGVDGKWVGALQGSSHLSVNIPPGEHHVCFAEKSILYDRFTVLRQLQAQPGKTYYMSAYMLDAENPNGNAGGMYMTAYRVNRDEGEMLMQSSVPSNEIAYTPPQPGSSPPRPLTGTDALYQALEPQ